MTDKIKNPYRTDDAQRLLDKAERAFEDAGRMMIRNPHQACNHFKKAVHNLETYGEMVNTARAADGRAPLNENQLCSHFSKPTSMADLLKVKETIERRLDRACLPQKTGGRSARSDSGISPHAPPA